MLIPPRKFGDGSVSCPFPAGQVCASLQVWGRFSVTLSAVHLSKFGKVWSFPLAVYTLGMVKIPHFFCF